MFGGSLGIWDIAIIVSVVLIIIVAVLYFLNRWAGKRMAQQNDMVEKHKQTMTIYVIDKKKDKIQNANLPKAMAAQIPRMSKLMKVPIVKAKIGKDIMTLMCDNAVYPALPVKKTVTVEMAGIYIVSMKGQKSKAEMDAKKGRKSGGFLSRFRRG
ncbi:MAG: hypothetical protein FWC71_02525 [Defluviitaleaceae bacterium]|nr:hypothetical protein [Defluviitaleaceae bacterium]